ncbi:MAG: hypothetical protein QOD74_449 [Variibacter sp.]|jgi:hypothetical protein|nr:hypothetical protein [Variibacter sp.]
MKRLFPIAVVGALLLGGLTAAVAWFGLPHGEPATSPRPVWTEVAWPFPSDPWGRGKAFRCNAPDCGVDVNVYLRAKLGFCDCTTGVADDDALDRMGDLYLLGEASPLGAGREIAVGPMKGRSRAYALNNRNPMGKTTISAAFNERCDMVVATAVLANDRPQAIEPTVIDFLNGKTVQAWAEVALGL